ncbi:MAG: SpoVR family protein [Desulfuromonas sp.]|uniref:SpoVR family protein n=1 Tax=Desulfuromonas sp. TaxID=892 RepID=UPI000CB05033|nr:SpoVR family protein [Desulfuromonas sp.]PLX84888.1 MAG: SpoVR family protein [Desulfuromonas sp.]
MELIDQHTKGIMEGCKARARAAGLRFGDETLEYIVTNRDLLELTPKYMIPTLYDYWVHDVEVLKEKGRYELYPGNPYETVINTRPAISFYNDNNPDWLNVMIFYHVLGHIDFFQNNLFFRHTWDFDLTGQALADKRLIARLRSEKGRWVDYVIEFARGIDNLVGYYRELSEQLRPGPADRQTRRLDYYFDVFLQRIKQVRGSEYLKEIASYNDCLKRDGKAAGQSFFSEVARRYPEFEAVYQKERRRSPPRSVDLLQFLMDHSEFLNRDENKWMLSVIHVVRKTSLYFQPQIRTKIMNEGWSSYWHEKLFMEDDRIRGHEVDFARVNAWVTSMPRVGLNPYALGMRLFHHIEEMADKGRYGLSFERQRMQTERDAYDDGSANGRDFIFSVREDFSDFTFLNTFVDQDFVCRHNLFVAEKRLNQARMTWEYLVKSRKAEDYRQMIFDTLYHPPSITVSPDQRTEGSLYLVHRFEEKPLLKEYIANTMLGIEYLWGGPVHLETNEPAEPTVAREEPFGRGSGEPERPPLSWRKMLYTMENRELTSRPL